MKRSLAKAALPLLGVLLLLAGATCDALERPGRLEVTVHNAPRADTARIRVFNDTFPAVEAPELEENMANNLATLPLSCIDNPHSMPRSGGYLYERSSVLRENYTDSLAFYGCYDWHSAVNSTWAMVKLYKAFPDFFSRGLIREKLRAHLGAGNLQGELAFFEEEDGGFERPYGWAWLMKLHSELYTSDLDSAQTWAQNVEPLSAYLAQRSVEYLANLSQPMRGGTHSNTAFSLGLMLEYARATGDAALKEAVTERARTFYLRDGRCPTSYEPSGSDFLSPCLAEAELMSRVLEPSSFAAWLRGFLPPVYSRAFRPLLRATSAKDTSSRVAPSPPPSEGKDDLEGAQSHLVGLSLYRAGALRRIARALPDGDPRADAYRKVARLNAKRGFEEMFSVDYAGTHWLGTYAVYYLSQRLRQAP